MPIILRDYLDFPFNSGRGIRETQIDYGAGRLRSYFGRSTYDAATNMMAVTVPGYTGIPSRPSTLVWTAPGAGVLVRDGDPLWLTINGSTVLDLNSVDGVRVAARDITPGQLLSGVVGRATSTVTLVEPLGPRPQDFRVVIAWMPEPPFNTQAVFEAAVAANSAQSALDDPTVTLPAAPSGVGDDDLRFVAFGVPMDAPDIQAIMSEPGHLGTATYGATRWPFADGFEYGGTAYKWFSITGQLQQLRGRSAGSVFTVEFAPYG